MKEKKFFPKNLRYLRTKYGESQAELAKALNRKNLSSPSDWERGKSVPDAGTLSKIANRYGVDSIDDLFDIDLENDQGNKKHSNTDLPLVPIVGQVAAGEPNYAVEDIIGYMTLPPNRKTNEGLVYLEVKSDSMDRRFPVGSYVLVDRNISVENGDVAVVKVNGDEATLKQVKFDVNKETMFLIPDSTNDKHTPTIISDNEEEIVFVGKVVGVYQTV